MLRYLISTVETLIPTAVLLGLLLGYVPVVYERYAKRMLTVFCALGIACALIMAYMKNKTKLIDTGAWNLRIFSVFIVAFLLFVVLDNGAMRKVAGGAAEIVVPLIASALAFCQLFYALPDVIAYPYTIVLGGESLFSTGFLYRMIGVVLGLVLVVLTLCAVRFVCKKFANGVTGALCKIAFLVVAAQYLTKILQTLLTRRVFSNHTVFNIVKFTSNHSNLFIYALLFVALVAPCALWIKSFSVNEPYENPAQLRKIKANWRSIRRWSTTVMICVALVALNMTAIKAYANKPVELSPAEECEIRDDKLYIPFEQVEDGHLHRFAYTTQNDVAVRFIIIKKPNATAYGVGLDACDICGETGYYERSGQVVCNRCDVVMNINTIGFKGGCNPKLIDYSVEGGYIIVPTATLIEHESDFK